MAKNEVMAVDKETTSVAAPIPAEAFMVELDPSDMMVPFLKVIQSLSEEVVPGKDKYNEDVRPGNLYDSITRTIIKEANCIVCGIRKYYAEWTPEVRGTLLGKHRVNDPKVTGAQRIPKVTDKGTEYFTLRTIDGNDLIETYGVVLLIVNDDGTTMPAVLTLSKTSFMVGKTLTCTLAMKQSGGVPFFRLSTTGVSNSKGSWFKPVFTVGDYVTDTHLLKTAKQLSVATDAILLNNAVNDGECASVNMDLDSDLI